MTTQPGVVISSHETTVSPPDPRPNLTTGLQPSPEIIRRGDDLGRVKRRVFIGPMPKQVVPAPLPPQRRNSRHRRRLSLVPSLRREGTDLGMTLDSIDDEHAFRFFLSRGGKEADWTQDADISTRREMIRKWRENSWATVRARARSKNKSTQPAPKWVGSTFEVGEVSGLGLPPPPPAEDPAPSATSVTSFSMLPPTPVSPAEPQILIQSPMSDEPESYFTAQEGTSSRVDVTSDNSGTVTTPRQEHLPRSSSSSNAPLLQPPNGVQRFHSSPDYRDSDMSQPLAPPQPIPHSHSEGALRINRSVSGLKSALKSRLSHSTYPKSTEGKGKEPSKSVTFPAQMSRRNEPPAKASEVLVRTGSDLNYTSAGATKSRSSTSSLKTIILRDRLLVRVAKTRQEVRFYDEERSRNITDLNEDKWQEFLVVWRRENQERLELYEDHKLPGKEYAFGRKHLAFVIPLTASTTKFSLFSFTDMSFCLTCPPTQFELRSHRLLKFFHLDRGTSIYIFKHKSRSRAIDWSFNLWRTLGGEDPGSLEIYVPALDTRIHIDIPTVTLNGDDGWKVMTPSRVVSLCHESLSNLPDFDYLISGPLNEGRELALAWRWGHMLDWVWLVDDINGVKRDWAVIYGLAFKTPGLISHLELRLPEYLPTKLTLADSTKLEEPSGIEGYVWRIKPNSQARSLTYLTTHDGYIFICPTSKLFLPQPPAGPDEDIEAAEERSSFQEERRRGTAQILSSTAVIDIRNIILVRRASQPSVVPTDTAQLRSLVAAQRSADSVERGQLAEEVATHSDNEDEGGDEGLAKFENKAHQTMKRCFELVMRTGYVIRFEVYSRGLVLDWVTRLQALVSYWTRRHRVDAREEMELQYATSNKPRFEANTFALDDKEQPPEVPPDPDDPSPYMSTFWNCSVLLARRPIIKCGRVFCRKGIRGPLKLVQLVLITGHLVLFKIDADNKMRAYQKRHSINLVDAYICSGQFAIKALDTNSSDTNIARRYQDGLESADSEAGTLFLLWYIRHPVDPAHKEPKSDANSPTSYPHHELSAKRKFLVIKARSRLERDAWCWALNAEMERLVRRHQEREVKLREAGGLVKSKR